MNYICLPGNYSPPSYHLSSSQKQIYFKISVTLRLIFNHLRSKFVCKRVHYLKNSSFQHEKKNKTIEQVVNGSPKNTFLYNGVIFHCFDTLLFSIQTQHRHYDFPHHLQNSERTVWPHTEGTEGSWGKQKRNKTAWLPLCHGRSVGSSHGQTQDSLAPTPALSPAPRWYKLYQCWRYLETTNASQ